MNVAYITRTQQTFNIENTNKINLKRNRQKWNNGRKQTVFYIHCPFYK